LVHSEGIEKSFDDDHLVRSGAARAMQIEEHQRFSEASRKSVLWYGLAA